MGSPNTGGNRVREVGGEVPHKFFGFLKIQSDKVIDLKALTDHYKRQGK